jgi:hypothetical protein
LSIRKFADYKQPGYEFLFFQARLFERRMAEYIVGRTLALKTRHPCLVLWGDSNSNNNWKPESLSSVQMFNEAVSPPFAKPL